MKAISDMTDIRNNMNTISENRYVVSTDAEAAPYGKFVEEGTRYMAPRRFMQKARDETQRKINALVGETNSSFSIMDDEYGDALLLALTKHLKTKAREFAPVDTGELAYGIRGRGIHIIKNPKE